MELNEKLAKLKTLREELTGHRQKMEAVYHEALLEAGYFDMLNQRARMGEEVEQIENDIRSEAVAKSATGEKLPEGVTVKSYTVVSIPDKNKARDWCLDNFLPAMMLDEKALMSLAKDGRVPEHIAEVGKELRGFIAANLP